MHRAPLTRICLAVLISAFFSPWAKAVVPDIEPGRVSHTAHPLVARYVITVPAGARIQVEFGEDTRYRRTTDWVLSNGGPTNILVAGMRPSLSHHMRAVVRLADGTLWRDADHVFETGAAPPGRVPRIKGWRSGLPMAPGVEVFNLVAIDRANRALNAVVTDLEGHLIWYYDHGTTAIAQPMRPLANGHILMILVKYLTPAPDAVLREVDLTGATIREMRTAALNKRLREAGFPLQAYEMHHEALPLDNGHTLILVDAWRNLSAKQAGGAPVRSLGDAVVDLDAQWRPVWIWNGFDHLDLRFHPWGLADWSHGNAIVRDPRDGNLLLSFRHLSWIVKIDYRDGKGSGNVIWRLGNKGDFALAGGDAADWFYGQHSPQLLLQEPNGNTELLVFDNGNLRPFDRYGRIHASRVVKLRYNEQTRRAEVFWSLALPWYSDASGSVQALPQGHLEYTAGWLPLGGHVAELDAHGREVWSLESSWQKIYRAWRIPSLYPGVTWE